MPTYLKLLLCTVFAVVCVFVSTGSALAGTPALNCDKYAVLTHSHRNQGFRTLSSAQSSKLQRFSRKAYRLCTTVVFVRHHPRVVAHGAGKWWQVKGSPKRRLYVKHVRAKVRRILHKDLPWLDSRIDVLNRPHFAKWLVDAFTCIHRYEGAWNSNTGNGYYGGMQMDLKFMRLYGPEFVARWGTANNWPIWAQLEASARAQSSRGFHPWPNTARACHLI